MEARRGRRGSFDSGRRGRDKLVGRLECTGGERRGWRGVPFLLVLDLHLSLCE